jgi:Family of unknown function (DUF5678)
MSDEEQAYGEPEPLPADDLEHYSGQWVAVRGGKVVAHHPSLEELQGDPDVLPTDDVFPIGEPPAGFYTVSA